jgi:hypothetical protein
MGKPGQRFGQTHQNQLRIGMRIQKLATRRQGDLGAVIATHTVHSNSNHAKVIPTGAINDKSPSLQDL